MDTDTNGNSTPISDHEIQRRVTELMRAVNLGDTHTAEKLEKQTLVDTLKAIAQGCENPQALAYKALVVTELPFARLL